MSKVPHNNLIINYGGINLDQNVIIFLGCICFICIFGRLFIVPIKKILELVLNSILGGGLIYIINLIGQFFNFHIGLNLVTSILVGFLGIPGAVVLILIKLLTS